MRASESCRRAAGRGGNGIGSEGPLEARKEAVERCDVRSRRGRLRGQGGNDGVAIVGQGHQCHAGCRFDLAIRPRNERTNMDARGALAGRKDEEEYWE